MSKNVEEQIKDLHLQFAEERGLDKTYCPSEVARKFAPDIWRDKMDLVREVADNLVTSGQLIALQKGVKIVKKPSEARGPIRLQKKRSKSN
ncbi:DUF3253 domain-containing protein [Costertonia aggregata]|uniref:DUF3253 domain-containing protein n=1 Tax=Costertonia aggregata TaxID=343403 RepID=A0A7H9ASN9_9FLAO|nr:DUF3253 domain-containing protein [Costertonia aggregata]QLG46498.1 DUF3253 domain-containing protein [Costertonia aggregata]